MVGDQRKQYTVKSGNEYQDDKGYIAKIEQGKVEVSFAGNKLCGPRSVNDPEVAPHIKELVDAVDLNGVLSKSGQYMSGDTKPNTIPNICGKPISNSR